MVEHNAKPMNPKQLVDEFKKSGEFDRLRRQLLTHFASNDDVRPLMSRIEEIVREKLSRDDRLEHKSREVVHSEVMQDMERYPIVERAVAELAVLKDEALLTSIDQYARNIMRGESNENTKLWEAKPSTSRRRDEEDEDNDGSSDYTEDEEPDDDDLLIITDSNRKNASRSPEPGRRNSTATNDIVHNGHSSPQLGPHPETRPIMARFGTHSPTTQANATNMNPATPSDPHEDFKPVLSSRSFVHAEIDSDSHSLMGMPSSDSAAGELLVNGVPVAGAHDTNRGGDPVSKEPSFGRKEWNTPRQGENRASPQREINGGESINGAHSQPLAHTNHADDLVKTEGFGTLLSPLRSSSPTHTPPRANSSLRRTPI